MSGAGGHGRGLDGDFDPAADHFTAFDDHGDFFFERSPCAGEGGGGSGGDGLMAPYSSIMDYLQGFLDPAGLAAHLDEPCRLGDDAVKREMEEVRLIRHDGPAAGAPPVTPNSSVLSSSSCEAGGAHERRRGKKGRLEEEEEQEEIDADEGSAADGNCKKSKEKKARGEKKPREPRVAFMTKSEVDHLEDGYRWRKYGQKAVKNSSYPRSYYRCTAARCGVKKRVERSQQDPSTVVTTYEGQHTHPSPVSLLRGAGAGGGAYALAAPQQLGFRHDLRAMIDYARGTRTMTPSSLLLPPAGGLPAPTPRPLQEHMHRRSSSHLAAYGGVLDFIPSAMGDGHA
ncbi:putative WRKY transcription factor 23 [Dichanthelium oligosanthes]|uniref:Putative WRKY transcription factor 23 n=1 Tax=Dichanthelium oligosanthes TaxID=888268 RepID=A0A1E5V412_9POAL|nr:putative WRKY transcription factor 23 [Dichanthelium oligosanthes]